MALTAGLSSCSNSFGYVRDNRLAGIVRHSPGDDPNRLSRTLYESRLAMTAFLTADVRNLLHRAEW